MAHHILYVPGFGDARDGRIQAKALKRWNRLGVDANFVPIDWRDSEPYEAKLGLVIKQIRELNNRQNNISLVGVSAGASLALNAYMVEKNAVSSVAFICGKLTNPEGVRESYFIRQPAFRKSVFAGGANVEKLTDSDKAKMLTVRSLYDGVVPGSDSKISGVKNYTLPALLHIPTIFLAITLYKRLIISFLKSRAA